MNGPNNMTMNYVITLTAKSDVLISPTFELNGLQTATNEFNKPYVPSSTFRGALATELRAWQTVPSDNLLTLFFGTGSLESEEKPERTGDGLLWISDLVLVQTNTGFVNRTHVPINRKTKLNSDSLLYTNIVCPKGSVFKGVISIRTSPKIPRIDELKPSSKIVKTLRTLVSEALGKGFSNSTSRGYNHFDFELIPEEGYEEIKKELFRHIEVPITEEETTVVNDTNSGGKDEWVILEKSIMPLTPWFIGSTHKHGNLNRGQTVISGQTIRGLLAWQSKRIENNEAFEKLHSDEVHVPPARICMDDRIALIPPLSFHTCKRKSCGVIIDGVSEDEDEDRSHKNSKGEVCTHPTRGITKPILFPRGEGSSFPTPNLLQHPKINNVLTTHISLDPSTARTGAGKHSEPYQLESWTFNKSKYSSMKIVIRVGCKKAHAESMIKVLESLDHTNAIGGARGKGYGRIVPLNSPVSTTNYLATVEKKLPYTIVLQSPLPYPKEELDLKEWFVTQVKDKMPNAEIDKNTLLIKSSVVKFTPRGIENNKTIPDFVTNQDSLAVLEEGSCMNIFINTDKEIHNLVAQGLATEASFISAGFGAIAIIAKHSESHRGD